VIIRAAVETDAAQVAELWNGMIRDTLATFTTEEWTEAAMAARIAQRQGAFWLAEDAQGLAGVVTFGPFRPGPGYAMTVEHSVILRASAQGRGVADRLMDRAEAGAAALGHRVMVAAISGANPRAIAFHARRGFRQTGHMPQVGFKAGQWLDLILMQKSVSAS
jgi:phosphinothricin acetyltransferase